MRRFALSLLLILFGVSANAAPHFPVLTGRVVDDAHVLSPQTVQTLEQKLAEYEAGTSNQVVVVTLSSLEGASIEDYGYQLGRLWGIGQKGKNNGVLLIVVPPEHKVRIEVGYGLEPLLTDAASSQIIHGIMLPAFRKGDMEQGIIAGTQAILDVLGGKSARVVQASQAAGDTILPAIIFLVFVFWLSMKHPFLSYLILSSGNSRFSSSGLGGSGWSGGGFSGGGGSFGGGGASGSW